MIIPEQKRLSRKFLIYKFATNLWFFGTVWLYFYRLFISDSQVGIVDAVAFFIGLLVEIPSGALADKFGRARVTRIGLILMTVGFVVQALGGFWIFLTFQIGVTVGASLISGADEALFYEKLKFKKTSHQWRDLLTRSGQVALIASLSANVVGSLIHTFEPTLTWLLTGLAYLIAMAVIWNVKDEPTSQAPQTIRANLRDYFTDIAAGFREFKKPQLRLYIPLIITVQGLFYAYGWGLLRLVLLSRFGFSPFWGSVAIASCALISILVLHLTRKYSHKLSEKQIFTTIIFMAILGLVLAIFDLGLIGCAVLLLFYVGEHTTHPFISEIVNKAAKPQQRSTILSIASFFKVLPYVLLAPIIGFLNDNNSLEIFLIAWAILSALAWIYYLVARKKNSYVAR